jgi:hypothetical protein
MLLILHIKYYVKFSDMTSIAIKFFLSIELKIFFFFIIMMKKYNTFGFFFYEKEKN